MSKLPDEAFRDTIGTIDEAGNRKFVFPKKPSGKFYDYRKWVSYFLLIVFVAEPGWLFIQFVVEASLTLTKL